MVTIAFIIIQLASLGVMLLFMQQYVYFTHKHETLLRSIDEKRRPASSTQTQVIIWIYAIFTLIVIFGTTALYLLEPLK